MMLAAPFKGLGYLFQGFPLLFHKGIRPFVVVPLLINIVLFSVAIWFSFQQFDHWMDQLLPTWLDWLMWLVWPLFAVLIFFAVFYTFAILANLIAAPFNALLSERIEAKLNGLPIPEFQGYRTIPAIMARTFRSEAAKLIYMLKWLVVLLLITFIPVVNVIAPFAWAFYGAWMLALEYADYPMGNHELYFQEELPALKRYRFQALGFGGGLSVLTAIPFINFFVMPIGVAGATVFWVKTLSNDFR